MLNDDKTISYLWNREWRKLQSSLSVKAGGGVNTVEISTNPTNECEWPTYRVGCDGLNIKTKFKLEIMMLNNDII